MVCVFFLGLGVIYQKTLIYFSSKYHIWSLRSPWLFTHLFWHSPCCLDPQSFSPVLLSEAPLERVKGFGRSLKKNSKNSQSFFCGLCSTIRLTAKKAAHSCVHPVQSTNLYRTRTFFKHRRIVFNLFCVLGIGSFVSQQAYMGFSFGITFVIILFLKLIYNNRCKKCFLFINFI